MRETYLIKKIFGPTIQGEGSRAGTPVKFLRFAGCNKWSGKPETKAKSVCWYCDTDFDGGEKLTVEQIIDQLNALGPLKRVVLSGGEPTLQLTKDLLEALVSEGYELHLETNGSKALRELAQYFTHITMSPKQGPGETKLEWAHDIKILYPWIGPEVSAEGFNQFSSDHKFIQALWTDGYRDNLNSAIDWLMTHPNYRLSIQTHKIIEVE